MKKKGLTTAPAAPASKARTQTPKAVAMARAMSRDFQTWMAGRAAGTASPRVPAGVRSKASKTPRAMSDAFGYINAQNMSARASYSGGMRVGPFVTRSGAFGWSSGGADDGY